MYRKTLMFLLAGVLLLLAPLAWGDLDVTMTPVTGDEVPDDVTRTIILPEAPEDRPKAPGAQSDDDSGPGQGRGGAAPDRPQGDRGGIGTGGDRRDQVPGLSGQSPRGQQDRPPGLSGDRPRGQQDRPTGLGSDRPQGQQDRPPGLGSDRPQGQQDRPTGPGSDRPGGQREHPSTGRGDDRPRGPGNAPRGRPD